MFVPPEERRSWQPPPPDGDRSRRGEDALLWLIGLFLVSMLLGPIAGGTVLQPLLALLGW